MNPVIIDPNHIGVRPDGGAGCDRNVLPCLSIAGANPGHEGNPAEQEQDQS